MQIFTSAVRFSIAAVAATTMTFGGVLSMAYANANQTHSAVAAPRAKGKAAKASEEKRYCVNAEAITGSRMPKKVCGTAAELEAKGIDVQAD